MGRVSSSCSGGPPGEGASEHADVTGRLEQGFRDGTRRELGLWRTEVELGKLSELSLRLRHFRTTRRFRGAFVTCKEMGRPHPAPQSGRADPGERFFISPSTSSVASLELWALTSALRNRFACFSASLFPLSVYLCRGLGMASLFSSLLQWLSG